MAKVVWSSKFAFVLAAAGAAVGLGNIWRFPYIAGEHGGGAFVLIYIACVIILGIPLIMSETLIGRRGSANPATAFQNLAKEFKCSKFWWLAGALQIIAGFLILSYYVVVTGWVVDFFFHAIFHTFQKISIEKTDALFNNLLESPIQMLFWATLLIIACVFIVARGIHQGLEKTVYFMFPALLVLMVVLLIYACKAGSFEQGFQFLFHPDFSAIHANTILLALGQAFFSLSIACGALIMYGKYVTQDTSIAKTSLIIAATDTIVALIAGLAIFPIVFANGLAPSAGPSLIFKNLPVAFGQMPFGDFFAGLFFLMLIFAAFTSAIALLEPTVVWCMESLNMSRVKATTACGFVLWLLSLCSIFSFNLASHIKFFGMNLFELLDHVTSNILLPIGALFIAIFIGWRMPKKISADEFGYSTKNVLYQSWLFIMRFVAPIAIIVIFLSAFGWI